MWKGRKGYENTVYDKLMIPFAIRVTGTLVFFQFLKSVVLLVAPQPILSRGMFFPFLVA